MRAKKIEKLKQKINNQSNPPDDDDVDIGYQPTYQPVEKMKPGKALEIDNGSYSANDFLGLKPNDFLNDACVDMGIAYTMKQYSAFDKIMKQIYIFKTGQVFGLTVTTGERELNKVREQNPTLIFLPFIHAGHITMNVLKRTDNRFTLFILDSFLSEKDRESLNTATIPEFVEKVDITGDKNVVKRKLMIQKSQIIIRFLQGQEDKIELSVEYPRVAQQHKFSNDCGIYSIKFLEKYVQAFITNNLRKPLLTEITEDDALYTRQLLLEYIKQHLQEDTFDRIYVT